MKRKLKLAFIIILLFFVLLLIPMVFSIEEDKYVQSWVKIDVSKTNTTVHSPNILEPKKIIINAPSSNTTINSQNYSFIMKTKLECTTSGLTNITEKLIATCNAVSDYTKTCSSIFTTNTELSTQIAELKTRMDGNVNLQPQLNDCQVQLTNEKNKKITNEKFWYGLFAGVGAFWIGQNLYANYGRRSGPEAVRGPTRL